MQNRKYNVWEVKLQAEDGKTYTMQFKSLWDPQKVSAEDIFQAAAVEATHITHRKHVGISAKLVTDKKVIAEAQKPNNPRSKAAVELK